VDLPQVPKEVSLDTSKDIRALKKEMQAVNKELKDKGKTGNGNDESGFEVAKVNNSSAVSLDSPEELELLQAELRGASSPASGRAQQPSAPAEHTTRTKNQPVRKPLIQGQQPAQQPAKPSPPAMKRPTIVQQPQAVPVPTAVSGIKGGGARSAPEAAHIEDFDRLLDEISPATIRRIPDPHKPPANDPTGLPPPPMNMRLPKDPSLEEMDDLVGQLDLQLGPQKKPSSEYSLIFFILFFFGYLFFFFVYFIFSTCYLYLFSD